AGIKARSPNCYVAPKPRDGTLTATTSRTVSRRRWQVMDASSSPMMGAIQSLLARCSARQSRDHTNFDDTRSARLHDYRHRSAELRNPRTTISLKQLATTEVQMEMAYRERWQAEIAKLQRILSGFGLSEERKWGKPCYTMGGKNVVIIQGF